MHRILAAITLVVALALAAGCGGEKEPAAGSATHHAHDGHGHAEVPPASEPMPAVAEGEVALAGTLGCGHCSFHVTEECAAAVKTASGDLYIIDGVAEDSELWTAREKGGEISVVGKVLESDDGLKHLTMTSFELKPTP